MKAKPIYSAGFEKFWVVWKNLTGEHQGKAKSLSYWKRDKLERRTDEIIDILYKQASERKRMRLSGRWVSRWCWCQKWLNEKRYEWVPEPPKPKPKPAEEIVKECTPEKKAKFRQIFDKMMSRTKVDVSPLTEAEIHERKRKMIRDVLKCK